MAGVETVTIANVEVAQSLLNAYGQAIGSDWGGMDGSSIETALEIISNLLTPGAPVANFEEMLSSLGIEQVEYDNYSDYHWF